MDSAEQIVEKALGEGRKVLYEGEAKGLLRSLIGIKVPPGGIVRGEGDALRLASQIAYPVVLKGILPGESHKTERGLVVTNVKSDEELLRALNRMRERQGVEEFLVEKMIPSNREFLLGLHRDETFGYVVVFGTGGVLTEVIDDVSLRVCPVNETEASLMINEPKASKMLGEFRGEEPVNREKLIKIIVNLSHLSEKIPSLKSVDINPLMPWGSEIYAADALVVLE